MQPEGEHMNSVSDSDVAQRCARSSPSISVEAGTSAAALQAIIDAAPEGATIVLQQGSYRFMQTVVLNRDGITLQGQGDVVIVADDSLRGAPAIQIGAPLFLEREGAPVGLSADATEGAQFLRLQGAHGVRVGDVIWVERPNDAALFAEIGDTAWQDDKPLRTGMAIVTAVNGGTIHLDRGLPFAFDAETSTVQVADTVHNVTVRGITVRGDYGTSNPGNFTNAIAGEDGGMLILVNSSVGTVLEDIDVIEPGSNGVVLGRSLDAEVSDVTVTGAHNKGEGGNGYAFWLRDIYDSTFSDLVAVDVRHAVLFASYTSAVGNTIHVAFTNRDINFHGGLDRDNTIVVDESVRNETEQAYMAAVTFINPGTSYGAPTDPNGNSVTFGQVVGTVRADVVVAWDSGARIFTRGGNDTIAGGAGDDSLDGGTGNDWIGASTGDDTVVGGLGTDTLTLGLWQSQAFVVTVAGQTTVYSHLGSTMLSGIERLAFVSGTVSVSPTATATVQGTAGSDHTVISASAVADSLADTASMTGSADIDFIGNGLANRVMGNDGDNLIFGQGGDDRLFGGRGDDVLDGGSGNDLVQAGSGNDTLNGGSGNDTMLGRHGADEFVASVGTNVVEDFLFAQGDRLRFDGFTDQDLARSLDQWIAGSLTSADEFTFSVTSLNDQTALRVTSDVGDGLILIGITASALSDFLMA